MKEKIVLIGFGGYARSVVNSIESSGNYEIAGYTDEKIQSNSDGYTFLGTDKCLKDIYLCGVHNACIAIGIWEINI